MKTIQLELPDKLLEELNRLVKAGWFQSEDEAIRMALTDFVRNNRFELMERFQHEDIAWAMSQKSEIKP